MIILNRQQIHLYRLDNKVIVIQLVILGVRIVTQIVRLPTIKKMGSF